jgi:hypothetical protein
MTKLKLSRANSVAPVFELVQLDDLLDAAGSPFVVQCERIPPLKAIGVMKCLPGARPKLGLKDDAEPSTENLEPTLKFIQTLIECGTALAGPDGDLVRPAFYFSDAARSPHSLDGNILSLDSMAKLATTVSELSGYRGVAAKGTFPVRKRG